MNKRIEKEGKPPIKYNKQLEYLICCSKYKNLFNDELTNLSKYKHKLNIPKEMLQLNHFYTKLNNYIVRLKQEDLLFLNLHIRTKNSILSSNIYQWNYIFKVSFNI